MPSEEAARGLHCRVAGQQPQQPPGRLWWIQCCGSCSASGFSRYDAAKLFPDCMVLSGMRGVHQQVQQPEPPCLILIFD